MKFLLPICFLLSLPFLTIAQEDTTEDNTRSENSFYHYKGQHLLNLSVGILPNPEQFAFDLIAGSTGSGNPTPAINLSYEYGLLDQISIGFFAGYYRVNAEQEFKLSDLEGFIEEPECAIECASPIPLGLADCDCSTQTLKERVNVITLAGKFSYHYSFLPKLDTYTSVTLGYSMNRRSTIAETALNTVLGETTNNTQVPDFIYYVSGGARYFFTKKLAGFGELGYSNVHLAKIGISYRL